VIAERLRRRGHDVFALDEHRELDGLPDADVLALAARDRRILVTFNVRDFAPILRQWAEAQRSHAGCLLLVGIGQHEFGVILDRISAVVAKRPGQRDWADRKIFLGRKV
jgi:Domain of unknown function (DUF5615)